jgi:UDP-2-acetamido-2,6-beta-L-arabino-hexul-4-ose reductase
MKILVTGSKGFIGQNLISELKNRGYSEILEYNRYSSEDDLISYCKEADFIYHLAGSNRSEDEIDFTVDNVNLTKKILELLNEYNNNCTIVYSSSIHADQNNAYGISKKKAEELLKDNCEKYNSSAYVYRLPNVFGKWSKENYNSVIATFCHNIAKDIPIMIDDKYKVLNLVYIDDLVNEMISRLENHKNSGFNFCDIKMKFEKSILEISELIYSFKKSRESLQVQNMSDLFIKNLYSTYLSFLPKNKFKYELNMNIDSRGSFTEFLKPFDGTQISVNISKPGITKGDHWHHNKNEKFLVVSGEGLIRLKRFNSTDIIEIFVSSKKLEVVDIPVGYVHSMENLGINDMVTLIWANETYDSQNPDTYYAKLL